MADRFDDAKRALDGVPAPDVWDEAQRRAEGGAALVPLTPAAGPARLPRRWLAVAAAVVLAAGTVAVVASDDDAPVDAGLSGSDGTSGSGGEQLETFQSGDGCKIGIRGPSLPDPALAPAEAGVEPATHVTGNLNATQTYDVQSPGQVVTDLVGERVEDVGLRRGTAQAWFQERPASATGGSSSVVQVRWFPGGDDPCDSFTVTVGGGTEDENRHAAVDLAERVVLARELAPPSADPPADNPLAGTEWQLERSTRGGDPTEGDGSLFTFTAAEARWSDGCNDASTTYRNAGDTITLGDEIITTAVGCPRNPTSEAIHDVMRTGDVGITLEGERLVLRRGDVLLELRQTGRTVDGLAAAYGIWPMTAPESVLGYRPEVVADAEQTAVEFAKQVLEWDDAEVDPCCGEPPHDGIGVLSTSVRSPSRGRSVGVSVRVADPASDGHVVYELGAEGVGEADVQIGDDVGRVDFAGQPTGTASVEVRFINGEYEYTGTTGEDISLQDAGEWNRDVPAAVLALFRDADGDVIAAWGQALRATDVST